jgi:hypothetical protein
VVVNFFQHITKDIKDDEVISYDKIGGLIEKIASLKRELTVSEKLLKQYVEEYNKNNTKPFEYESDKAQYTLKSRNTQIVSPDQMLTIVKEHCTTDQDYIQTLETIIKDLNIKKSDVGKIGIPDFMLTEVATLQTSESSYILGTKLKVQKGD